MATNKPLTSQQPANEAPNEQVLKGRSYMAPSLTSYLNHATYVAWNENGKIYIASDQTMPPYEGQVANPDWLTVDTPAIALAMAVRNVYLAWQDGPSASIYLASAADGWKQATPIVSGGVVSAPALVFSNEDQILYLAWMDGGNGFLFVGALDQKGGFNVWNSGYQVDSRPSIMLDGRMLRVFTGGDPINTGGPMMMFSSKDQGQTWTAFRTALYVHRSARGGQSLGNVLPGLCERRHQQLSGGHV